MRDDGCETLFEKDSSETMECKTTQVNIRRHRSPSAGPDKPTPRRFNEKWRWGLYTHYGGGESLVGTKFLYIGTYNTFYIYI